MVKSYTLAGTAAFVCLILAIGAVVTTFHILNDISEFYNEAQEELVEFKDIANNVWDEMVFESTPEEMREAEELDREKRGYEEPAPYGSESSSTSTTSTTTSTTTTSSTPASVGGDESGYDFGNDNGPPSSRPQKPVPPTVPRTIQGFRAPPPGATSTYRPPSGRNYDNYGREPASSRRPYPPYQPYQSSSTVVPTNASNNRTPYNPPTNPQTVVYPPNQPQPRVPYHPPNYTQTPSNPKYPTNSRVPVTPPPREPTGGYDSDRQTPPSWPKVYNTRRPNSQGYPEDQVPTLPPTSQRVPPTQTHNQPPPKYPDHTNSRQPGGPLRPNVTTPPTNEIPTGKAGSRPGFGPQRPRFPSSNRPRTNPCDQCAAQPNTCPPGPPGPRGRPGPPGFPGQDGPRGLRGLNGGYVGINPASYDPVIGCVQCPVGPPGERGQDGAPGYPGEDGIDGEQGRNGNDGQSGAPGAPGYPGMNGIPGAPGKPGTPGRNGQSCRSMPGPPGKPGMAGPAGRPGDPGIDGEHGQNGSPGIQGPPGRDGNPGIDGPEGISAPGAPGTDGGYCPCPKRSSKYDFADAGFIEDDRRPRTQKPREHSAEHGEEAVHSRYEEDSEYAQQRRPNYEQPQDVPYPRSRYGDEDRSKEHPKTYTPESRSRRPPPPRQTPRHQESRYPEEYERRPQESRGYENERPRGYTDERPRMRTEESHSSGYGGDERKEAAYAERRPVAQSNYETSNEAPSRPRPLKKVEINRNPVREYEQPKPRREEYETERPRQVEDSRRYETETEMPFEEEQKKDAHPPGFRRPKPQEERREHESAAEESLPAVKQTDKFDGEKRKKTQPEYEDISKSEGEDDKSREKHHKKPNKFQEQQWEEHRKSQELRNSREHGGQLSAEMTAPMQQVKPKEAETRKQRSSAEERPAPPVHDNYQSSEKQAFSNENPLPSEQLPYRRKNRFYRNHYYEKFLA